MARGIKLLVVACNTARRRRCRRCSEALAPLPVIGVIEPGAQAAVAAAPDGPIAVIATEGTVKGGAYVRAIQALAPDMPVVQQACPLFVPLAEEGLVDGPDRRGWWRTAISTRCWRPCRSRACWCWAARIFRC